MTYRIFQDKLSYGQYWEDKAKEFLKQNRHVEITAEQTSHNYQTMHFDFQTSDGMTYEVKADRMSVKTGNFFIEYEGYGKPSGISITKAKKHIITDEQYFYIIRTRKLKQLIKDNNYNDGIVQCSNTKGRLVPKADIIEHSHVFACI